MAKLAGIDVLALTDHNSLKNCPALFEAAESYGIVPIAGTELTTSEDIHVICLFEHLSDAMRFDEELSHHRMQIENRPDIFGRQLVLDGQDNILYEEKNLLSFATDLSLEDVPDYCPRVV
jgi:predicted metal-dependent phosphoesterase TrpH